MPRRPIDVQFDAGEKLWRRVEVKEVRADGSLKPSALRLQVSVVRQRHGNVSSVPVGKWNGVCEVAAQDAVDCDSSVVAVSCVDDPSDQDPGHALLAFSCTPGVLVTDENVATRRQVLANKFTVVRPPT